MIEIRGASHRLCSGVSRRDVLRVGALGAAGLTLADLLALKAEASPTGGKAKSVVMIHLGGGPSHLDTYDPKPDAPQEIRGEFNAIPTKVDGIRICELFPLQAAMMDRLSIVRSVHRVVPEEHASSLMVTGYTNTERRAIGDRPSIGAVLARLRAKPDGLVAPYVTMRGTHPETGLSAAHVGPNYEPLDANGPGRQDLKLNVNAGRLEGRRKMLDRVNAFRKDVESGRTVAQDAFAKRALEIVTSSATYNALDTSKENEETRKRYGNDQFLAARRLLEAGSLCVALEVGGWDTHSDNFKQLRNIMPPLDKALTALLSDLKDRGMDQETVVVMWGEFGRTPKVNGTAGRDHWPSVMSALIAGGGLKMGQVIGATDASGSEASDAPYHARSVVATMYHALGIDPATTFIDQQARPIPLIHDAEPIPGLIG